MEHIIKKRTKFIKGNFKPKWDCINRDFASLGRIIPSKIYQHYNLPYFYSNKSTVLEKKHFDYQERRSIMNWLV